MMGTGVSCCCCKCAIDADEKFLHKRRPYARIRPFYRFKKRLRESLQREGEGIHRLRLIGDEVAAEVSPHDRQLLLDNVNDLERKYTDLQNQVDKSLNELEQKVGVQETLKKDIQQYKEWLSQTDVVLQHETPLGHTVQDASSVLQKHQVVVYELQSRESQLGTVRRQMESLKEEMSPQELNDLQMLYEQLQQRQQEMVKAAEAKQGKLAVEVARREALQQDISALENWLTKMQAAVDAPRPVFLKSANVGNQVEALKKMQAEVKSREAEVERVRKESGSMMLQNGDPDKEKLYENLKDIERRYAGLQQSVNGAVMKAQDTLIQRRQMEADVIQVDVWWKEADSNLCSKPMPLEGSLEEIHATFKKYQAKHNEAFIGLSEASDSTRRSLEAILKSLMKRGEQLVPNLSKKERSSWNKDIEKLRKQFYRVAVEIRRRLKALEDALVSKSTMEEELAMMSQWLEGLKEDMRLLNKPIGHQTADAELRIEQLQGVEEKLGDYKSNVEQLLTGMERAKELGQPCSEEEVRRVEQLYKDLCDQAKQHSESFQQALTLRQTYYGTKGDLEEKLVELRDHLDAVLSQAASPDYKVKAIEDILESLKSLTNPITQLEDTAQQIGVQGTPANSRALREQLKALRQQHQRLIQKAEAEKRKQEQLAKERSKFNSHLQSVLEGLHAQLKAIDRAPKLPLDLENTEAILDRHYDQRHEINAQLANIQEQIGEQRAGYEESQDEMPAELTENIDQFNTIQQQVMTDLDELEKYLIKAKEDRQQLHPSWKVVADWLKRADENVKPIYEGINYDNIDEQIHQHKTLFADEPKCGEQLGVMGVAAEQVTDTLDLNDATTLKETLANLTSRFQYYTSKASEKSQELEDCKSKWNQYKKKHKELDGVLRDYEKDLELAHDDPPKGIEHAREQCHRMQESLHGLQQHEPVLTEVNDLGTALEGPASKSSRNSIEQQLRNLNDRWKLLINKLQEKVKVKEDTLEDWETFQTQADELYKLLLILLRQINGQEDAANLPLQQLQERLEQTKVMLQDVTDQKSDLSNVQKAGQAVLVRLPPSDAKAGIQKTLLNVQDKYEELDWKLKEQEKSVETLLGQRQKFVTEISETMLWLRTISTQLDQPVTASIDEMDGHLDQQHALQQQVQVRLAQVQQFLQEHDVDMLPVELQEQVTELKAVETSVGTQLVEKEQKLEKAQISQREFLTKLQQLVLQIQTAESNMQTETVDIPGSIEKYRALVKDIPEYQKETSALEAEVVTFADIMPAEKVDENTTTLTQLDDQCSQMLPTSQQRLQDLEKADQLVNQLDSTSELLNSWADQVETVLSEEVVWTHLTQVEEKLVDYQRLAEDADNLDKKLSELTEDEKWLQEQYPKATSDTVDNFNQAKLNFANVQTQIQTKMAELRDVQTQWLDYQREVSELDNWMAQTRQAVETGAEVSPLALQEQLQTQELLISDIESHQAHADTVLKHHQMFRSASGRITPTDSDRLRSEIEQLQEQARRRKTAIQEALKQQQEYEAEVCELHNLVTDAQEELAKMPVNAADLQNLKQQIARHNEKAAEIREMQHRIDDINEMSKQLGDGAAELTPIPTDRPDSLALSDEDSAGDAGLYPTPSSFSGSLSSWTPVTPGEVPPLERKDSGVLMSPDMSEQVQKQPDAKSIDSEDTDVLIQKSTAQLDQSDVSTVISDATDSTMNVLREAEQLVGDVEDAATPRSIDSTSTGQLFSQTDNSIDMTVPDFRATETLTADFSSTPVQELMASHQSLTMSSIDASLPTSEDLDMTMRDDSALTGTESLNVTETVSGTESTESEVIEHVGEVISEGVTVTKTIKTVTSETVVTDVTGESKTEDDSKEQLSSSEDQAPESVVDETQRDILTLVDKDSPSVSTEHVEEILLVKDTRRMLDIGPPDPDTVLYEPEEPSEEKPGESVSVEKEEEREFKEDQSSFDERQETEEPLKPTETEKPGTQTLIVSSSLEVVEIEESVTDTDGKVVTRPEVVEDTSVQPEIDVSLAVDKLATDNMAAKLAEDIVESVVSSQTDRPDHSVTRVSKTVEIVTTEEFHDADDSAVISKLVEAPTESDVASEVTKPEMRVDTVSESVETTKTDAFVDTTEKIVETKQESALDETDVPSETDKPESEVAISETTEVTEIGEYENFTDVSDRVSKLDTAETDRPEVKVDEVSESVTVHKTELTAEDTESGTAKREEVGSEIDVNFNEITTPGVSVEHSEEIMTVTTSRTVIDVEPSEVGVETVQSGDYPETGVSEVDSISKESVQVTDVLAETGRPEERIDTVPDPVDITATEELVQEIDDSAPILEPVESDEPSKDLSETARPEQSVGVVSETVEITQAEKLVTDTDDTAVISKPEESVLPTQDLSGTAIPEQNVGVVSESVEITETEELVADTDDTAVISKPGKTRRRRKRRKPGETAPQEKSVGVMPETVDITQTEELVEESDDTANISKPEESVEPAKELSETARPEQSIGLVSETVEITQTGEFVKESDDTAVISKPEESVEPTKDLSETARPEQSVGVTSETVEITQTEEFVKESDDTAVISKPEESVEPTKDLSETARPEQSVGVTSETVEITQTGEFVKESDDTAVISKPAESVEPTEDLSETARPEQSVGVTSETVEITQTEEFVKESDDTAVISKPEESVEPTKDLSETARPEQSVCVVSETVEITETEELVADTDDNAILSKPEELAEPTQGLSETARPEHSIGLVSETVEITQTEEFVKESDDTAVISKPEDSVEPTIDLSEAAKPEPSVGLVSETVEITQTEELVADTDDTAVISKPGKTRRRRKRRKPEEGARPEQSVGVASDTVEITQTGELVTDTDDTAVISKPEESVEPTEDLSETARPEQSVGVVSETVEITETEELTEDSDDYVVIAKPEDSVRPTTGVSETLGPAQKVDIVSQSVETVQTGEFVQEPDTSIVTKEESVVSEMDVSETMRPQERTDVVSESVEVTETEEFVKDSHDTEVSSKPEESVEPMKDFAETSRPEQSIGLVSESAEITQTEEFTQDGDGYVVIAKPGKSVEPTAPASEMERPDLSVEVVSQSVEINQTKELSEENEDTAFVTEPEESVELSSDVSQTDRPKERVDIVSESVEITQTAEWVEGGDGSAIITEQEKHKSDTDIIETVLTTEMPEISVEHREEIILIKDSRRVINIGPSTLDIELYDPSDDELSAPGHPESVSQSDSSISTEYKHTTVVTQTTLVTEKLDKEPIRDADESLPETPSETEKSDGTVTVLSETEEISHPDEWAHDTDDSTYMTKPREAVESAELPSETERLTMSSDISEYVEVRETEEFVKDKDAAVVISKQEESAEPAKTPSETERPEGTVDIVSETVEISQNEEFVKGTDDTAVICKPEESAEPTEGLSETARPEQSVGLVSETVEITQTEEFVKESDDTVVISKPEESVKPIKDLSETARPEQSVGLVSETVEITQTEELVADTDDTAVISKPGKTKRRKRRKPQEGARPEQSVGVASESVEITQTEQMVTDSDDTAAISKPEEFVEPTRHLSETARPEHSVDVVSKSVEVTKTEEFVEDVDDGFVVVTKPEETFEPSTDVSETERPEQKVDIVSQSVETLQPGEFVQESSDTVKDVSEALRPEERIDIVSESVEITETDERFAGTEDSAVISQPEESVEPTTDLSETTRPEQGVDVMSESVEMKETEELVADTDDTTVISKPGKTKRRRKRRKPEESARPEQSVGVVPGTVEIVETMDLVSGEDNSAVISKPEESVEPTKELSETARPEQSVGVVSETVEITQTEEFVKESDDTAVISKPEESVEPTKDLSETARPEQSVGVTSETVEITQTEEFVKESEDTAIISKPEESVEPTKDLSETARPEQSVGVTSETVEITQTEEFVKESEDTAVISKPEESVEPTKDLSETARPEQSVGVTSETVEITQTGEFVKESDDTAVISKPEESVEPTKDLSETARPEQSVGVTSETVEITQTGEFVKDSDDTAVISKPEESVEPTKDLSETARPEQSVGVTSETVEITQTEEFVKESDHTAVISKPEESVEPTKDLSETARPEQSVGVTSETVEITQTGEFVKESDDTLVISKPEESVEPTTDLSETARPEQSVGVTSETVEITQTEEFVKESDDTAVISKPEESVEPTKDLSETARPEQSVGLVSESVEITQTEEFVKESDDTAVISQPEESVEPTKDLSETARPEQSVGLVSANVEITQTEELFSDTDGTAVISQPEESVELVKNVPSETERPEGGVDTISETAAFTKTEEVFTDTDDTTIISKPEESAKDLSETARPEGTVTLVSESVDIVHTEKYVKDSDDQTVVVKRDGGLSSETGRPESQLESLEKSVDFEESKSFLVDADDPEIMFKKPSNEREGQPSQTSALDQEISVGHVDSEAYDSGVGLSSVQYSSMGQPETGSLDTTASTELEERHIELEDALLHQQEYQDSVQHLSTELENMQQAIESTVPDTRTVVIQEQINQHQDDYSGIISKAELLLRELNNLQNDLDKVKQQAEDIMDKADDKSQETIHTTLTVIKKKYITVGKLAKDKDKELQLSLRRQQEYEKNARGFEAKLEDLEAWLAQAKMDHAGEPLVSLDVPYLRQQIAENEDIQKKANDKLQSCQNLQVQCDQLLQMADPIEGQTLRLRFHALQQDLQDLSLSCVRRQDGLHDALTESERRYQELKRFQESVENLNKWMEDTRKVTEHPLQATEASDKIRDEQNELQQQLSSDIQQYQQLVKSVSETGSKRPVTTAETDVDTGQGYIDGNWRTIYQQLALRKLQLREAIAHEEQELGPMYYQPIGVPQYEVDNTQTVVDVRSRLDDLQNCWDKLESQVDDKQARLEQTLQVQQVYQDALMNISIWLDSIELKLSAPLQNHDLDKHLKDHEELQKELQSLEQELKTMTQKSQEILRSTSAESRNLIRLMLEDLNSRLHVLEDQAKRQQDNLKSKSSAWRTLKTDVGKLYETVKNEDDSFPAELTDPSQQLQSLKDLDNRLGDYQGQLDSLTDQADDLCNSEPTLVIPPQLGLTQTLIIKIRYLILQRYSILRKQDEIRQQYLGILKEYGDYLKTAETKLQQEQPCAINLPHLKQQLHAHTQYFDGLLSHRGLMDGLADLVDEDTRKKNKKTHEELRDRTDRIKSDSEQSGLKLQRMITQWEQLENLLNNARRMLRELQDQETDATWQPKNPEDVKRQLAQWKALQNQLDQKKAPLYQSVDKGRQLLQSVSCPALEAEVNDFADQLVRLSNNVNSNIKRLESLADQQEKFDQNTGRLESWLAAAPTRLTSLGSISQSDASNISTMRKKIDNFLEFRKEVENQQQAKTDATNLGQQLVRSRPDDCELQDRLERLDHHWVALMCDLPNSESQLHNAQMDLLPSRQALHELMIWMEVLETVLEEDANSVPNSALDTQLLLQKYRGIKVDLGNRQLTVDFVNQSATQYGELDSEGVQAEKTDFDEKLGQMNTRYKKITAEVSEKLKMLELQQHRWDEYEKAVASLSNWLTDQQNKLENPPPLNSVVGVQQREKEIATLNDQLGEKKPELQDLEVQAAQLLTVETIPQRSTLGMQLKDLQGQLNIVSDKAKSAQKKLDKDLLEWQKFQELQQKIQAVITETLFNLDNYQIANGDFGQVSGQLDQLKVLRTDFSDSGGYMDSLKECADNLSKRCDPAGKERIQNTVSDFSSRWYDVADQLQNRVALFETLIAHWDKYNADMAALKSHIDDKNKEVTETILASQQPARSDKLLKKLKGLQAEVQDLLQSLAQLEQNSAKVTAHLDDVSAFQFTVEQTQLRQRLQALLHTLETAVQHQQAEHDKYKNFKSSFKDVAAFLVSAKDTLRDEDPNRSAEEDQLRPRLEQLQGLSSQFCQKSPDMDKVNDLGNKLQLTDEDAEKVQKLTKEWQQLCGDANQRSKKLQSYALLHQDFHSKCQQWLLFLAQVEKVLSAKLATTCEGLQEQQRDFETFQSDMYGQQQVLQSIITDGQKLMQEGDVEDRRLFQQKLQLLDSQWQSVVRRADQRKSIISNQLSLWNSYRHLLDRLRTKLGHVERAVEGQQLQTAHIQQLRLMMDSLKRVRGMLMACNVSACLQELHRMLPQSMSVIEGQQQELQSSEDLYSQVQEMGKLLQQSTDDAGKQQLQNEMQGVQQELVGLGQQIQNQRERLASTIGLWDQLQESIRDQQAWLRDLRKQLDGDLPENYDDLQKHLQMCKEFEASFESWNDKKDQLTKKQGELSEVVSKDDLAILSHRISLLCKHWQEMLNQVLLRQQLIQERLNNWSDFNQECKTLQDSMTDLERTITSNRDQHIEDLISLLQNDWKQELERTNRKKNNLVERGHQLARRSGDVRASDIEQKINSLDEQYEKVSETAADRLKKLQETLLAVQQLEANMSQLREWLSRIERQLGSPVVFQQPTMDEIQAQLQQQQEMQKDIENHSSAVSSVLNLCEVLLCDKDACPTQLECDAIEQAKKNLDKRWTTICSLIVERRQMIEETWNLWQQLHDDLVRFEEWLKGMAKRTHQPHTDNVRLADAREELKKYEDCQREILDHLTPLEQLNRQYRRLAREGRTDASGRFKTSVLCSNRHWDDLNNQVAAVIRRLRHMINVHEDYEATREGLMLWVTDMSVRVGRIELQAHTTPPKPSQIKTFHDEVDGRTSQLEYMDKASMYLMMKSEPEDSASIQQDAETFQAALDDILNRLHALQIGPMGLATAAKHVDDVDVEFTESSTMDLGTDTGSLESEAVVKFKPEKRKRRKKKKGASNGEMEDVTMMPKSFMESSVDWELLHGETLGSTPSESPRTSEASQETGLSQEPADDRWAKLREELSPDDVAAVTPLLLELENALKKARSDMQDAHTQLKSPTPRRPRDASTPSYVDMIQPCQASVDEVHRITAQIRDRSGLSTLGPAEQDVKVVTNAWQKLQRAAIDKDLRHGQGLQQRQQFTADLNNLMIWMGEAEAMVSTFDQVPTSVEELEPAIRRHQEFLAQLDSKKPIILSLNLLSRELLRGDDPETRDQQAQLLALNQRFDGVCEQSAAWYDQLQRALAESLDFYKIIQDLFVWLDEAEAQLQSYEPIDVNASDEVLQDKYKKLTSLHEDLEGAQARILSLRTTAEQILTQVHSDRATAAKEDLAILSDKLRALLKQVNSRLILLRTRLNIPHEDVSRDPLWALARTRPQYLLASHPLEDDQDETDNFAGLLDDMDGQRRRAFLSRVLRTAVPIQVLMLLLLGMACLVPMGEDDYSCVLTNNLRRSLDPMLRYTDGPPPF